MHLVKTFLEEIGINCFPAFQGDALDCTFCFVKEVRAFLGSSLVPVIVLYLFS